jgi:hypothetical protein
VYGGNKSLVLVPCMWFRVLLLRLLPVGSALHSAHAVVTVAAPVAAAAPAPVSLDISLRMLLLFGPEV